MNIDGINYLGLDRVLKRGSGEIIEEMDRALLIRDEVSGAYMLACDDAVTGMVLLDRHIGRNCSLLMVSDYSLGITAFERYGFAEKLECYQVAYFGEKPSADSRLTVRAADEQDLPMLVKTYHLVSPEELEKLVSRRSILLGYEREKLIGFIGEHPVYFSRIQAQRVWCSTSNASYRPNNRKRLYPVRTGGKGQSGVTETAEEARDDAV